MMNLPLRLPPGFTEEDVRNRAQQAMNRDRNLSEATAFNDALREAWDLHKEGQENDGILTFQLSQIGKT